MWKFLHKFASPKYFYHYAGRMLPWLWVIFLVSLTYSLVGGLYLAPADYQQGDAFRIIYVHVPAAALSLGIYAFMAVLAILSLIWRIKLTDVMLKTSAKIGAWLTLLALITGSLWGKPMWGTWWIWDARLTSELILLFIYLAVILLHRSIPDEDRSARACAILTLVGVVDLPIIHYSVYWWNTLHQGSTILQFAKPTIAADMLYPLLASLVAFASFVALAIIMQTRNELLKRYKENQWVQDVLPPKSAGDTCSIS